MRRGKRNSVLRNGCSSVQPNMLNTENWSAYCVSNVDTGCDGDEGEGDDDDDDACVMEFMKLRRLPGLDGFGLGRCAAIGSRYTYIHHTLTTHMAVHIQHVSHTASSVWCYNM